MVERVTLDHLILVRVQVPQPTIKDIIMTNNFIISNTLMLIGSYSAIIGIFVPWVLFIAIPFIALGIYFLSKDSKKDLIWPSKEKIKQGIKILSLIIGYYIFSFSFYILFTLTSLTIFLWTSISLIILPGFLLLFPDNLFNEILDKLEEY